MRLGNAPFQRHHWDVGDERCSSRHSISVPRDLQWFFWVGLVRPTMSVPPLNNALHAESKLSAWLSLLGVAATKNSSRRSLFLLPNPPLVLSQRNHRARAHYLFRRRRPRRTFHTSSARPSSRLALKEFASGVCRQSEGTPNVRICFDRRMSGCPNLF